MSLSSFDIKVTWFACVAISLMTSPCHAHAHPQKSGIECFGAHLGAPQTANLGDGHGWVNQTIELRNDYGNPDIGSCWESLAGGNHLRLFRQNGPKAPTNALFLAYVVDSNTSLRILLTLFFFSSLFGY